MSRSESDSSVWKSAVTVCSTPGAFSTSQDGVPFRPPIDHAFQFWREEQWEICRGDLSFRKASLGGPMVAYAK